MEYFKIDDEKNIYLLESEDFILTEDLSGLKHFVVLLVENLAGKPDPGKTEKFIVTLLDSGMVFFSAWGTNCEFIHDLIDNVLSDPEYRYADDFSTIESIILTAWHKNDSLEETVDFMINGAVSAEDYMETTKNLLIVVVNDRDSIKKIKNHLIGQI
jgi:hypothetical protein